MESEAKFQDYLEDTRLPAAYAYIGSIILANACLILAPGKPHYSGLLYNLSLFLFLLPLLAAIIGSWKPSFGFWVFITGLILSIIFVGQRTNIPGVYNFLIIPPILALVLRDPKSALITGAAETAYLIFDLIFNLSNQSDLMNFLTPFLIWTVLLLILHVYWSNYQFFKWTTAYYLSNRESILEARKNNEKLEQMMNNLSYANNLLLHANERADKLRWVAEEAKNAKAKFVANVSHEFRTPLNMIFGLVELIVESPQIYKIRLPMALENDLRVVLRNCQHLSEMINDILDLTRLESGQIALRKEKVNLVEIMEEAAQVVQPLIKKKGLQLIVTYPQDPPVVYCDKTRIRQVILNLMSNAARFTEQGYIHGEIIRRDGNITVQVTDTGPGIPANELKMIFEPFMQGASDPWKAQEGSGLGLSVSKQFVELHGGQMSVRSEVGRGSSFKFTLPVNPDIELDISPASMVIPDWVWREDQFKAAVVDPNDQKIKPCVITFDREGYLAPVLKGINADIDFRLVHDLSAIPQEVNNKITQAVLCIAPQTEDLLQALDQLKSQVKDVPIMGMNYTPIGNHLLSRNVKYLTKPVTLDILKNIFCELDQPPGHVLLVEDNPDFLQLMHKFLLSYSPEISVAEAVNGVEALDMIKRQKPDVILLDIIMEKMDGWQLLEVLQRDPDLANIQIVIISAQDPYELPQTTTYFTTTISGGIPLKKCLDWLQLLPATLVTGD